MSIPPPIATGDKAKAREIVAAIRTLKTIEREDRPATSDERDILARFGGFGAVARVIFPKPNLRPDDPAAAWGGYADASWQAIGEELKSLLSQEECDSAKASTYNAFYTSPTVIHAMHDALERLGVPHDATVLEPGCGTGNFLAHAHRDMRFVGVERDSLSGRIARVLHPEHDIRIEGFQDTRLPDNGLDAVIGNPPFADVKLDYRGERLSLHDYFFAKSLDALKVGGILALVTSHFTLDKQNAAVRDLLAAKADFLGAIRLPSDAFRREGTDVVTDIVFLRKRAPNEPEPHADPEWKSVSPLAIEGVEIPISRYFLNHPEMVLGSWSRKDRLYDGTYSLRSTGDLGQQLRGAIECLPRLARTEAVTRGRERAPPFVPPPPLKHIAEGSFFVGDDRTIYQRVDGQSEPVIYHGVRLRADGTPQARKIANLIELRDAARRVLQSQNEGWPQSHRDDARKALGRLYDRFHAAHGPINKTTFTPTKDGGTIRRMPNLVKFREDPDAMLVMSLEEYDEVTGIATKAAILRKDVVGKAQPITTVASAEEGLLVALDRKGAVDLPFIAELYGKPENHVIEELGDLIFLDPESKRWQTADEYLSGNVRAKLVAAQAAGPEFERNASALMAVQPEDVLPGEIDANLGAPWIPESDIQAFAAHLFGLATTSIAIGHLKKDALWTVDADYSAHASVAATSDYGTARAGGVTLLDQALNLKTPVIYDTIHHGDREERVVNQEETLAAREKQKRIKEAFKAWVFADPDRTERLVRVYNDTYNNIRLRVFDGSHLEFPGMNTTIELDSHQKNAVWRGMSAGNTLLAHCVGAGKTYTMAATGMKLKQAGLGNKPIYVVPNNMLEQFAREFMHLYPNAKLLVAPTEDLARHRRKLLTAKIASSEWDGIIATHSSNERINMSPEYRAEFLREQIAEYDQLLCDTARNESTKGNRNLIKQIEKQKARREEKLKDLLAQDKKDDGLVFDELGIDHLFIDEAHYFKNLETPTKMDRVAGIQTGGSERAFDLFMKCRYLDRRHPGHGITFATGTPVSNTIVELYTLSRFLDTAGLRERGIEHFDGWAATFCEVVEAMEISPDGASLRPRSRFRFVNIPELQQMFRAFADVQTADMLGLPTPALEGGKAQVLSCPMSDDQAKLQQTLVERYERIRKERIDPREDNALAITTDGRKLALRTQLLSSTALSTEPSKIDLLVDMTLDRWRRTSPTRGTQLVFCDLGVNPTAWGYSVYGEITDRLKANGIPSDQIAVIGDADSDAKKQALFERVRQGSVRILLGSTQKMGVGTNVQKRLAALHHLDAPWKPAEIEQREGRILRQGNENAEVAIYRYVTEASFDAYMWQALEQKARFISQLMTGDCAVRTADDIGGQELSYAEVKAIASGNPAILTLAETDAELQRLATLKKHHADEQFLARRNVRDLPGTITCLQQRLDDLTHDKATTDAHASDPITIGDHTPHRDDLIGVLVNKLDALPEKVSSMTKHPLGRCKGLAFGIVKHAYGTPEIYVEGAASRMTPLSKESQGPRAVLNAVERLHASCGARRDETAKNLAVAEGQLRDYNARLGVPFTHEAYINELAALRDQLKLNLSATAKEEEAKAAVPTHELCERIRALKDAQTVEVVALGRHGTFAPMAERPVTARIRERMLPQPLRMPEELARTTPETHSQSAVEKIALHATQTGLDEECGVSSRRYSARISRQQGGQAMARKATKAAEIEQELIPTTAVGNTDPTPPSEAGASSETQAAPDATKRFAPDPFPLKTANVDGAKVQLQQSRKYNEMQIRFGNGTLDDKPPQEIIDFVKQKAADEGIKVKWNNHEDARAWGMWINPNSPATSRQTAERVFDAIVERLREEHGAAMAR